MKLIKIVSDKVQIKTDQFEFQDARINDLIVVSDGETELMTSVSALSDTEIAASYIGEDDFILEPGSIKVLECSIIGSIKNGTFSKSIDRYPTTDIRTRKVDTDELKRVLSGYERSGFCIGTYATYNVEAFVDGNKFFQRHSCIVGNTGSGKSETVAKILEEISKLAGANVIVFDIHGEYKNLSYARNIKVGNDFAFPMWMFGFSGMVSNVLKVKEETATVAMSALRKCYYDLCPDGKENKPVYFNADLMIELLNRLNEDMVHTGEFYKSGEKAGLPKMVKGDFNGKLGNIINSLEDKKADVRYAFLFQDKPQEYLKDMVYQLMSNDKPVKNVDLSDIPHDVAIAVIGSITKLVYDIQRTYRTGEIHPLTLVCDEAHVYIPNNLQLSASEKRMVEVFEEIAKEGRKFGISLFVASQRPSELNKTIMAQCANFIVSKLNNENDKTMMKGVIPDGSESVIDSTITFHPGEVLIIGDAVPIPLKIQVTLAKERPESRTIDFWDEWAEGTLIELDDGINKYMNS